MRFDICILQELHTAVEGMQDGPEIISCIIPGSWKRGEIPPQIDFVGCRKKAARSPPRKLINSCRTLHTATALHARSPSACVKQARLGNQMFLSVRVFPQGYLAAYQPCQSCLRRNGTDFFQYMQPKNIRIVCRKGTGTCIISASACLYPTRWLHRFRLVHRKKFRLPVTRGEASSPADPRRYKTGERRLIYSVTVCSCCPPCHLPDRRYCLPWLTVLSSGPSATHFQRRWRCRSRPLCRS
jgi:hypothetical protein